MFKFSGTFEPYHYIFFATLITAALLVFSAYHQLKSAQDSAVEMKGLLKKATIQLAKTDSILESQQEIIATQIETIKQLIGADDIPKIKIVFADVLPSNEKANKVTFYAENSGKYPIYNLEISIRDDYTGRPRFMKSLNDSDHNQSSAVFWEQSTQELFVRSSIFTLPKGQSKQLHISAQNFGQSASYELIVNWMKGSYRLLLQIDQENEIPTIKKLTMLNDGNERDILVSKDKYLNVLRQVRDPKAEVRVILNGEERTSIIQGLRKPIFKRVDIKQ
ncbi:hypothetical protein [Dyadobacter sp.]|uniref:hypothetical protein n=1 Tax=Dyadobacter sp. TaxID=1914288 RepID=UPI003F700CE1